MVDIVLVKPPLSREDIYGKMSSVGPSDPPLGLANLAAYLRNNHIGVEIIDADAMCLSSEDVVAEIVRKAPKYVGITAVTLAISSAARLAQKIKDINSEVITILGGVHLSAAPRETMEKYLQFDVGVIGEGEITLFELIKNLDAKGELKAVNGLVYRLNNEIFFTDDRKPNLKLDSFPPPAWDLIPGFPQNYPVPPYSTYKSPSSSLMTSRGCGRRCTFCFQGTMGRTFRAHSAEYVMEIITHLYHKYGIRDLRFQDDQFLASKKRTEKVCNMLIEAKLDLSFSCLARIDTINDNVLRLLKRAGCRQINFGIESGSQRILDLVKKDIVLEDVFQAVKLTKAHGIRTMGYFMVGFPSETEGTIQETIAFAKKLPLDDASFFLMAPFPGSELYNTAHTYGEFNKDWEAMNVFTEPCFIPHGLTKEKLVYYRNKAMRQFYLRPRIVLSHLKSITSLSQLAVLFSGALTIFKLQIASKK